MTKLIACLLPFLFLSCEKDDSRPYTSADPFIVGNVGGWGGSRALKLEDDRLYVSGGRVGVELDPAALVAGEWNPYGDSTDLAVIQDLLSDLPAGRFTPANQRLDCMAAAYDGACPFIVRYEQETGARGWTAEPGVTTGPTEDYMDRLQRVVNEVLME